MSTTAAPIYLHYKLRLRSPAIVSTLSGDPNSAATQPFIPGSALRGVLAARLIATGVAGDADEFRRLILSGDVRYLHAYPELAGERSLPSSSSWRSEKADPSRAIDLAAFSGDIDASVDADDFERVWPNEALVAVPEPFAAASASAGGRSIAAPSIGSRLHQQRDRVKGRPWKDPAEQPHGALFVYEYLEPDQVFRGIVQIMPAAAADMERIKTVLGAEPILVGRSRRAGYGGEAEVELTGQTQREYQSVSGSISRDVAAGTVFNGFLASAYIGRHPTTGQIDPSALRQELLRRLGAAATVERTRWTFEAVGGFNQKWRLEVPQAQAVAAGAVLVLKATAAIPAASLRAIEHEGIGERRVEGFGRLLFLEHSDDQGTIRLYRGDDQVQADGGSSRGLTTLSEQDRRQLDLLERRIVLAAARAEIDRVAAIDLAARTQNRPTNSLLGRLRTLFRRATDEPAAQAALANLRTWCSDGDNPQALKPNAREKLDRCRVSDGRLRQWLRRLAESAHGEAGWDALVQAAGNQATLTGLAAKSHLTARAAAEAVLHEHSALLRVHLIDSVLGAMARLNRRGAR
ncbi:MAG: hypothetical protein HYV63_13005 [Candidatus Schekmanbacteria bacterium]|nr:hypothetical protein [Candidatus Schekmanbacteria bacterium]